MRFKPHLTVLPEAQRSLWPHLAAAANHSFVLYGGTAIALHLGHRQSVDFDFFRHEQLDKAEIKRAFAFPEDAAVLQDAVNTFVVLVQTPSGPVKVSFFGGIRFGRIENPVWTTDGTLLVASTLDLLSTKLKAILDRAEPRDYQDIAALLRSGVSLARGLGAFKAMFGGEPSTVMRAIGFFEDGNLRSLPEADQSLLRAARDQVHDLPEISAASTELAVSRL